MEGSKGGNGEIILDNILSLNFVDNSDNKSYNITISENSTGNELRKAYSEVSGNKLSDFKIRIFANSIEVKDDQSLKQQKISDKTNIQIIKFSKNY